MKDHKFVGYIGVKEELRKNKRKKICLFFFCFEINNTGCNTMRVGKSLEQTAEEDQG
jgi:hypothetical protein